ncbi:MAG TPA: hypothetical protein PLP19_21430 [bacterium]|nr:hypothetical protein [bacterium]HPN46060.1 hypothetical protein [bacterium]
MVKKCSLGLLIVLVFIGGCKRSQQLKYKPEIAPYVQFLQNNKQDPVDYVLSLFQKNDLVIICERMQAEYTQYDFIYRLVSDQRFIDNVGVIFTELGSNSLQKEMYAYLHAPSLSEADIAAGARTIYRNAGIVPFWANKNVYDFLTRVYKLNTTLPDHKKINIYPADMTFRWDTMTKARYKLFLKKIRFRDQFIADYITNTFLEWEKTAVRQPKALVILNYRHGFNDFEFYDGSKGKNTGRFLFEKFRGRIANVMLNSIALTSGLDEQQVLGNPIQDGKWDAAFAALDLTEAAFDLAGSPFGADPFDYYKFKPHKATYADVFTGFVFSTPLREQKLVIGYPGLLDDDFKREAIRRFELQDMITDRETINAVLEPYMKIATEPVENIEAMTKLIDFWLK